LSFTPGIQADIRSKIARNSDRLTRFLSGLHTGALGRVEGNTEQHSQSFGEILAKLDKIHQDIVHKKRNASILTDINELQQELIDDNITEMDVETNRDEIAGWLSYIRGRASLRDIHVDITNNPWNEHYGAASLVRTYPAEKDADVEDQEDDGTDSEEKEDTETEEDRNRRPDVKIKHADTKESNIRNDRTPPAKSLYRARVKDCVSESVEDTDEESKSNLAHTSNARKFHSEDTAPIIKSTNTFAIRRRQSLLENSPYSCSEVLDVGNRRSSNSAASIPYCRPYEAGHVVSHRSQMRELARPKSRRKIATLRVTLQEIFEEKKTVNVGGKTRHLALKKTLQEGETMVFNVGWYIRFVIKVVRRASS
jgi:hypothetical protein